jgi:hypothetical protein
MRNLYTIILCFSFFSIQAQNYYYNGSEKIEIHQSEKSFISYDTPSKSFAKGFKNVKTFSTKRFTLLEEEKSDISARKFRKRALENKKKIAKGFDIINQINNEIMTELSESRLQLIKETEGGQNEEKIKEWKDNIATELKELYEFRFENKKKIKLNK